MSPSSQKAEEATESKMTRSHPPEGHEHADGGGVPAVTSTEKVAAKRQRRPSVRLGDIGGYQSSDSYRKTTNKNHNWGKQPRVTKNKSSKTCTVMNLKGSAFHETLGSQEKDGKLDTIEMGKWKIEESKSKTSSIARVRSKFSGGDDKFRVSDSESPDRENSPIHSSGNLENENDDEAMALEAGDEPCDSGGRNWKNNGDGERNGVKVWLNQLGLGRYEPVFEIHEVDEEVLPLLTLEDLKDMGINAVGSRRKLYASIQKLREGFS